MMTRNEKIKLLKGIASGNVDYSTAFNENMILTLLNTDELNTLLNIKRRSENGTISPDDIESFKVIEKNYDGRRGRLTANDLLTIRLAEKAPTAKNEEAARVIINRL